MIKLTKFTKIKFLNLRITFSSGCNRRPADNNNTWRSKIKLKTRTMFLTPPDMYRYMLLAPETLEIRRLLETLAWVCAPFPFY